MNEMRKCPGCDEYKEVRSFKATRSRRGKHWHTILCNVCKQKVLKENQFQLLDKARKSWEQFIIDRIFEKESAIK